MAKIERIDKALKNLSKRNMTTMTLGALDFIVPGEWENIRSFDKMMREVTGEDDEDYLEEIKDRAIELFKDKDENYQTALKVYHLVDDVDKVAGTAAMANLVGGKFQFLSFMERFTPKADTTQAIDAGVKFVAELTTFCLINGIPGDSVMDFVRSLTHYGKADIMRISAWIAIDCLVPLGPDFMRKIIEGIESASSGQLTQNPIFKKLSGYLPGDSVDAKKGLILTTANSASDWVNDFVASKGLSQELIVDKLKQYVDVADKGLDYMAAALDIGTDYFEHTGTQTVARQLISRAYGEV